MMLVRRASLAEQDAVEALASTDKATKEFAYLWRRFGNWTDRSMPIVAVEAQAVVGFHAAAFGRVYVNSYYQITAPAVRGRGVGGAMVAFLLTEAQRLSCTRLKFKVPHASAGQAFWEGFGLRPFGRDPKHLLYDIALGGVTTPSHLATADHALPDEAVRRYIAGGVELLDAPRAGLFR